MPTATAPQTSRAPEPRGRPRGRVLGVQGVSGGVGASILTAALAVRAVAAGRRACAVDGCPWGGGLDVLVGLDAVPGARWPDLATMRAPRGDALLAELPGSGGLSVLSWEAAPPVDVPEPWSVLPALRTCVDLVVVDLPAAGSAGWWQWLDACDEIILIVGGAIDGLRPARAVLEGAVAQCTSGEPQRSDRVGGNGRVRGTVLRLAPGGVEPEWVAAALGLPILAELGQDDSVAVDLVRGRPVGTGGELSRVADQVLAELAPGSTDVDGRGDPRTPRTDGPG